MIRPNVAYSIKKKINYKQEGRVSAVSLISPKEPSLKRGQKPSIKLSLTWPKALRASFLAFGEKVLPWTNSSR